MEAELLTLDQVAARLHIKPRTVQAWVRCGRIPAMHLTAKVVRFDWAAIMNALKKQEMSSGPCFGRRARRTRFQQKGWRLKRPGLGGQT